MLKGIDISKWQAGIDLSKIDTDFVICKATEGVGYTDKNCDGFYQQAKKLGKKLGVYHFARPDLRNTAIAEADWFVRETKGYHKEAILILDWESGDLGNVTWAKQWLDRVYEKTGVKPVIYMSASVMSSYNWSSVAKADYGLWVANYGSNNGTAQESVFDRYPLKYWSFYALWQYTSTGKLSGYSGNLDLNYFSGDESAWDKYAGGSASGSVTDDKEESTSDSKKPDQVLYKGSKVQFYGCQISDIKTVGDKTTFYADNYGVWLPIESWYRVGADGKKYENQISSKGNWLMNNNVYTVKSVSKNPDRAVIEVQGKDYNVLSKGLYEVSNK